MTPTEAARILELPADATPDQVVARFHELRAKIEEKIGKAPTPGLKAKYRETLDEITLAFETMTLAADSSALPVLARESGARSKEQGTGSKEQGRGTGAGDRKPEAGGSSPAPSSLHPAPATRRKSGSEFLIVALIAVVVLGAGGWFIMKTRAENAEQARLEAVARAEAEQQAAQQAAAEKAEQERLARLAREQAEEARLAAEAEKQRLASLLAELLATQAEQKVRWQAIEQELSVAERKLSDLRADARNTRDLPPPRQAALQAQLNAQETFVDWLRPWLLRHEARGTLARLEALLSARALEEGEQAATDLVAGIGRAEAELTEQRDRMLTLTGRVRLRSEPAGIPFELTDAYGAKNTGRTPTTLELPLGQARATFARPNWQPQQVAATVRAREETVLETEMVGGSVVITSTPAGAEVRWGDRVMGKTPLQLSEVPVGPTTYQASLDGYIAATLAVTVRPRETTTVDQTLEKVDYIALDEQGRVVQVSGNGVVGAPVSDEKFDELGSNYGGLSWIGRNKKYGYVDINGRLVVPLRWDGAGAFHEGRAKVKQGSKWGFIDHAGRVIATPQWDEAWNFSDGLAMVRNGSQRGYVNRSGTLAIPMVWQGGSSFLEGLACVKTGGKWGFINPANRWVIQPQWQWMGSFSNGRAGVQLKDKWGQIDKTGNVVLRPRWDNIYSFRDGITGVQSGAKWGFVDANGRVVIPVQWDGVYSSKYGRVWCWTGQGASRRFSLFDNQGRLLVDSPWDTAYVFSDGLAIVSRDGKHGYIDTEGRVVIDLKWDSAGAMINGRAVVRQGSKETGRWGIIDRTGRILMQPQFKSVAVANLSNEDN